MVAMAERLVAENKDRSRTIGINRQKSYNYGTLLVYWIVYGIIFTPLCDSTFAMHNIINCPSAYTGWPPKNKPLPIFQKIVLKIANDIRFLRKIKV